MTGGDKTVSRARLKKLPQEIGQAHLAKDIDQKAMLCAEKALHLEFLQVQSGSRELLAQAQKEAAEALEAAGLNRTAMEFYQKAMTNLMRLTGFLSRKTETLKWQGDRIANLKGILAGYPDKEARARLEVQLRQQGILGVHETLRYEVNVEEVERLIKEWRRHHQNTRKEAEFTEQQLTMIEKDLEQIQARLKRLKAR